ncbi:hypothetical protein ONZ45_g14059 [Pleurotus djamor]|nr:hypothetical protein ONZ45_g14059 [Pleurotus djamor]
MSTMPPTLFPQSYTDNRTIDGPSVATTTFPVDPYEHSGYLIPESQCSDPSLGYPQTRRTHQVDGYLHQPIPRASHPGYSALTMNVPQVSETFDHADHLSNSYLTSTSHPIISQREIEDARSRPRRLSPLPYARRVSPSSSYESQDSETLNAPMLQAHVMGVPMHQDPLEYKLPRLSSVKKNSDKKQILACLFCRERKIACGRPPEGSEDPTCNQCARRAQRCEYPTESRRGLHRRATYRHLRTHSANGFT